MNAIASVACFFTASVMSSSGVRRFCTRDRIVVLSLEGVEREIGLNGEELTDFDREGVGVCEGATDEFLLEGDVRGLRVFGEALEEPEDIIGFGVSGRGYEFGFGHRSSFGVTTEYAERVLGRSIFFGELGVHVEEAGLDLLVRLLHLDCVEVVQDLLGLEVTR